MIDSAFIMAFIGAAVALIIGVIVYSEISDAINDGYSYLKTITVNGTFETDNPGAGQSYFGNTYIKVGYTDKPIPSGAEIWKVTLRTESTGGGAVNMRVGIYDRNNNLLGVSDEVTTPATAATDFDVPFTTPVIAPLDGEGVRLGLRGTAERHLHLDTSVYGGIYNANPATTSYPNFDDPFVGTPSSGGATWYHIMHFREYDTISATDTPEAQTRADSIAFTILGIMPISMFFGLFTIFGGFNKEIS